MNTTAPNLESLAGCSGKIAVVIEPRPCGGPLAYSVVTHPAALHVRSLGIDLRPIGAFTKGNQLHCTFKTRDLSQAIPALMTYFEQIELAAFCKFGFRLPDPAPNQLERWRDVDAARSYNQATTRPWRDRLQQWWGNRLTSPRVWRAKVWWFNRRLRGDLAFAFVALATAAGLVAWLAAFHGWPVLAVIAVALSVLAFAGAILTRPLIPLEEAERLIARAIRDGQDERTEFIAQLKGETRNASEGAPRE